MKEKTFFTDVKPDGKIQTNISGQLRDAIKEFVGKRIYIKLGVSRKIRSLSQSQYYWGVVVEFCREGVLDAWGESIGKDEAHNLLKIHANYNEKVNELTSESIRIPMPTHNLTTLQFEEFQERCRQFIFNMFNITVPLPNEQGDLDFKE